MGNVFFFLLKDGAVPVLHCTTRRLVAVAVALYYSYSYPYPYRTCTRLADGGGGLHETVILLASARAVGRKYQKNSTRCRGWRDLTSTSTDGYRQASTYSYGLQGKRAE